MPKQAALVYEDLEAFPNDDLRREIIGGELYVTPSPVPRHQQVVLAITLTLNGYAKLAGGRVYISPVDVVLSAQNVVVPDVVYVSVDRLDTVGERALLGVPNLFVEVLSPSTRHVDRGTKLEAYARFNLPEYWIVDVEARTVERCSDPRDGRYQTVIVFDRDMPAATLPGFVLSFEEIFA